MIARIAVNFGRLAWLTRCLPALLLAPLLAAGGAVYGEPVLEEVVVTAQKREENLYEVPISVSAFSDDKLEQAIIDDVADLGRFAPSLTANNVSAGGSNIFMRGVGNEIIAVGADSSVAIYIDGVYTPRFTTALNNFVDVERVELVKGPQGTLYGRNATGGAINIVTKQPSAEASFKSDVEISNYSGRKVRAAGGGAISDTLFGRLALVYNNKHNYSYNPVFDERLDVEDMFAANASLKWQPSDGFEALLRYDHLEDDALGVVSTRVLAPGAGHAGLAFDPDPFVNGSDFRVRDSKNEMESRGFNASLTWDFGNFRITSLSAWKHFESDLDYDADGTERPLLSVVPVSEEESRTLSEELRIEYTGDGPWEWMAGFFYFDEDARQDLNLELLGGVLALVPLSDLDVEAWALFGELSFNPTERLKLTAGLRYSDETKEHVTIMNGVMLPDSSGKASWDAFTPKFTVGYDLSEDLFVYATASRGFKSGGFNSVSNSPVFDPEYLWNYEVGLKGTAADGRVRGAVTGFIYDYTDIQVRIYPEVTGAPIPIDNASKAEVKGLEVEGSLMPFDNFQFDLSIAYIDGSYKDYITANPNAGNALQDLSGNRMIHSPRIKANIGAEYVLDLGGAGSLALRGEYIHSGKIYFDQFNVDQTKQASYDLWNAYLTYTSPDGRWTVAAWGKNLDDEVYVLQIYPSGLLGMRGLLAPPRTYGIRVGYRI